MAPRDIRTGPEAADVMASWKSYPPRLCLNAVSRAFQYGDATHVSQIDPLVAANNAAEHWSKMPAEFKHPGSWDAPKGAVIQFGGGQGHIILSLGGGWAVSTDYPSSGVISAAPIPDIIKKFSGNPLLGWGEWINGRPIRNLSMSTTVAGAPQPPATKTSIGPVIRSGKDWAYRRPQGELAKRVVRALQGKGRLPANYPNDGDPREVFDKAVQQTLYVSGVFRGLRDGVIERGGSYGIQDYAAKFGDYKKLGGIRDGRPEVLSWSCFALGLERP